MKIVNSLEKVRKREKLSVRKKKIEIIKKKIDKKPERERQWIRERKRKRGKDQ